MGSAITFALSGAIAESFGWEWDFYFFGIVGLVSGFFWIFLVSSTPSQHRRISKVRLVFLNHYNYYFIPNCFKL